MLVPALTGRDRGQIALDLLDPNTGPLSEAINLASASVGNLGWPVANQAHYLPILVRNAMVARQLAIWIGTANTGNIDLGIYRPDGTRLVSTGSVAAGATSALQIVDITDTPLAAGHYLLAAVASATTVSVQRVGTAFQLSKCYGHRVEAAALPLPVAATFALPTAAFIPNVGLLGKAA